jgi:hypothetical protein
MIVPFNFEYYLKKGIIKKITPDLPRAKFLLIESENSFKGLKQRVEKMGIDNFNSNSIVKDVQDIILERVRAEMLKTGFSASGNYSHEAEVSFLNHMSFQEKDIIFINTLRKARNGITYYGTIFDKAYAKKCFDFLLKIKNKLNLPN